MRKSLQVKTIIHRVSVTFVAGLSCRGELLPAEEALRCGGAVAASVTAEGTRAL